MLPERLQEMTNHIIGHALALLQPVPASRAVLAGFELRSEAKVFRYPDRFEDERGKFAHSLLDTSGSALVVSQFTLVADTDKGNRPSFTNAAPPEQAEPLYEAFCTALAAEGPPVETGVFGARMAVALVNDGPVTIVLD